MRSRFPAILVAALFLIVLIPYAMQEVDSKQSNPDGGGYKYTDAMDPEPKIVPNYVDIKSDINVINYNVNNYDYYVEAGLGFNFDYYGQTFSKIKISIYGAMSFVENSGSTFTYSYLYSYNLPNVGSPKGLIAVNWRTDRAYGTDKLYSLQTTIDNEKVFIVDWNTQSGAQYQALLYESGMILFQYKTGASWYDTGEYCVIGIESPDSTTGTAYVPKYEYLSTPKFPLPFAVAFTKEEISVDRIELLDGDGASQKKIYAGSKDYTFRTDITHSRSYSDIISAQMTLGSKWGQEQIQLVYFHQNMTFLQLTGINYATLDPEGSSVQVRGTYGLEIQFKVDFKIPYPSEERRNVSVRATGKASIPNSLEVMDLYYVEDDLDWDPTDLVVRRGSGDGSYLVDGDYVAGSEQVMFSGFKIFYEREKDIQPRPSRVQLNITDNHGSSKITTIPKGGELTTIWTALDHTAVMTLKFKVYGKGISLKNMVPDSSEFEFKFNIDATPPGDLSKQYLHIYQDELGGSEEPYDESDDIHYDNDDNVYVEWGTISDGESGIGSYLVEVRSEGYYLKKVVNAPVSQPAKMSTHLGERVKESLPEGRLNLTVRAVDIVGNIGPFIYTTLIIDKTGPVFKILSPSEGEWALSNRPKVNIEISDDLSPIDGQSLFYRSSTNGGLSFSEWESFEYYGKTKSDLLLDITPRLTEGKENVLEIKGQDLANSGLEYSDELPIWIDSRAPSITIVEPEVDVNGTTIEWLKKTDENIVVVIHDFKGIGIDPTGISYRYSLGNGNFSSDTPLEGFTDNNPYNNSYGYEEYSLTIPDINWHEGDGNLLVIDAWDKLGRNSTAVFRIRMDVMPTVEIISPLLGEKLLDNQSIRFAALISDLDGEDDIEVTWMSNIDGPFSFSSSIETFLSAGQHIITLTVNDGVHTVKRSFSINVIMALTEDPAYRDTDGDGMNDSYEISYGMDPDKKDGDQDIDNDGYSNLEEYYAGTDPTNKKTYPGASIKENKIPIMPIILIVLGLIGLLTFGALTVRESNRTPPDPMGLPPMTYNTQTLPPSSAPVQDLPALPPVQQ